MKREVPILHFPLDIKDKIDKRLWHASRSCPLKPTSRRKVHAERVVTLNAFCCYLSI
jgi:hypothetical protein